MNYDNIKICAILVLGALLLLAAWYCLGRAIGAWLGVFDDDWR